MSFLSEASLSMRDMRENNIYFQYFKIILKNNDAD